jgi:hypothetical protein
MRCCSHHCVVSTAGKAVILSAGMIKCCLLPVLLPARDLAWPHAQHTESSKFIYLSVIQQHSIWNGVVLKKVIVGQLVKTLPAFYGTRRFIAVFTRARRGTLLSQMNPVHSLKSYLFKIGLNFMLPCAPIYPMWSLSFRLSNALLYNFRIGTHFLQYSSTSTSPI